MDNIENSIRKDRMSQGLSLRGLAKRLNADRSLELEREVTTSWLHHLENGRAKALGPEMKRGIARALRQDENKYLQAGDFPQSRPESFARFFDEELHSAEPGSTLVCDVNTDFSDIEDLAEVLLALYSFSAQTGGKIIAFERSSHFMLPVLLAAIRSWPNVNDVNLHEVVSQILTPAASGGFVDCTLPKPEPSELEWVADHLELYEVTADEQASALLASGLFRHFVVVSPNHRRGGMPEKRAYYLLGPQDYGMLDKNHTEQIYSRFEEYRDLEIFSKADYKEEFISGFAEMGKKFRLVFA